MTRVRLTGKGFLVDLTFVLSTCAAGKILGCHASSLEAKVRVSTSRLHGGSEFMTS